MIAQQVSASVKFISILTLRKQRKSTNSSGLSATEMGIHLPAFCTFTHFPIALHPSMAPSNVKEVKNFSEDVSILYDIPVICCRTKRKFWCVVTMLEHRLIFIDIILLFSQYYFILNQNALQKTEEQFSPQQTAFIVDYCFCFSTNIFSEDLFQIKGYSTLRFHVILSTDIPDQ